jgi:hypothetical protein
MLLVNTNLRHDTFPLPQMSRLEATAVCLQLQNHNKLIFVSAYLPPTATITQKDLDAIFSPHDTVILTGDLNCKHVSWNNASVNKNGSTLLSYCLNNTITINYPNQPTHFPYISYPSVLNIALSQQCTTSKPLAIPALSSDHNPIDLCTPKPSYDYKHANWPLFRSSLDSPSTQTQPSKTQLNLNKPSLPLHKPFDRQRLRISLWTRYATTSHSHQTCSACGNSRTTTDGGINVHAHLRPTNYTSSLHRSFQLTSLITETLNGPPS